MYDETGAQARLLFTGSDCGTCSPVVEAEAMQAWAVARGVPLGSIIVEPDAQNTVENAWFAARILAKAGDTSAVEAILNCLTLA